MGDYISQFVNMFAIMTEIYINKVKVKLIYNGKVDN